MKRFAPLLLAASLVAGAAAAQSNSDPEIDVLLGELESLQVLGREGVFPDGLNGCVFATTACNAGTKLIQWKAPMLPEHPFIGFLLARELDGRFEQISDRSWVKHGYFALSSNDCGPCTPPLDNTVLGLGCSDTYSINSNGNRLYLGPPDEVDPWLGAWDPVCSHFDRGEPPANPPLDCNGLRSLTQAQVTAMGPLTHRILVKDSDLAAGGTYWFQAQYVVGTEPEASRGNNLASLGFFPFWNGASWSLGRRDSILYGSVLQRWSGASLASATNGGDDGRFYVAVKVTGPSPDTGLWHYEYAVHDRDNRRGAAALRVPICTGARVVGAGFGDVDDDAANDWSAAVVANELVFSGPANPLKWNTLFNFWFDSDAAPAAGAVTLDQAAAGPGLPSVAVASQAPLELYNVFLGPGCSLDVPPPLFAVGTPPRATLGNASFALRTTGNARFQPNHLRYSVVPGTWQQGPCTRYLGPSPQFSMPASSVLSDANGVAEHAAPVPSDVALEGLSLSVQTIARDPAHGILRNTFELSDGLRVRVGSALPACP